MTEYPILNPSTCHAAGEKIQGNLIDPGFRQFHPCMGISIILCLLIARSESHSVIKLMQHKHPFTILARIHQPIDGSAEMMRLVMENKVMAHNPLHFPQICFKRVDDGKVLNRLSLLKIL